MSTTSVSPSGAAPEAVKPEALAPKKAFKIGFPEKPSAFVPFQPRK